MNIVITILKVVLALLFSVVGIMKLSQPIEKLAESLPWVNDFSHLFVRVLGGIELAIGILLVIPLLIKSIPQSVSAYAALTIVLIMIGAGIIHFQRGEYAMIGMNIVLLIIGGFIAYQYFPSD